MVMQLLNNKQFTRTYIILRQRAFRRNNSEFWAAGVFRLVAEICKISSPMVLREIILYVQGESEVVPNSLSGGLGLATVLFIVALLQACTLQHFIHGGLSILSRAIKFYDVP